jgi:hypothetical protein
MMTAAAAAAADDDSEAEGVEEEAKIDKNEDILMYVCVLFFSEPKRAASSLRLCAYLSLSTLLFCVRAFFLAFVACRRRAK